MEACHVCAECENSARCMKCGKLLCSPACKDECLQEKCSVCSKLKKIEGHYSSPDGLVCRDCWTKKGR